MAIPHFTSGLVSALRELVARHRMGHSERFEHDAELFYREKHFIAPGRSIPPAMNAGDAYERGRQEAWDAWTKARTEAWIGAMSGAADLLESLTNSLVETTADLAETIGERDFWKAQHDDKQTALEMAEHRLNVRNARPLQPSDVMAVQWKNDGDGGSLAAIKAIDDDDEIVFAADGTPALEIESPGRDVERVDVGDYVVRRVVGGLMAMKREVFEQTQRQIAEMGEPIGRLVYEDGSPISKPETER
jgi:hypothetical protein